MKRKAEIWTKCYCIDCSLACGQIIEVSHRRISRKCAICHRTIPEILNAEQSEEKTRLFWQLWQKEKQWPERRLRVQDREYEFPAKPLREHLKLFERTKDFVFLTMLESILSNPQEYQRFREFVERDKQRREQL